MIRSRDEYGGHEGLNVDAYLVDQPSRTVLLTVKEDSMIEAGLMPGDTVVVKKGAPTKPGDVVVATVDNEFTVKYLAYDRHGFFLKPGNRAYVPIRSKDDLEIYGLVVGMFRKYPQRDSARPPIGRSAPAQTYPFRNCPVDRRQDLEGDHGGT